VATLLLLFAFLSSNALELTNNHIRIATNPKPPFVYYDDTQTGNSRFSGFLVDMVTYLFQYLDTNTTYEWYLGPDGSYGIQSANGSWDGLIEQVLIGNADLIVADETLTQSRLAAIDFTSSYLDIGLTLLVPAPPETIDVWSFLSPFTPQLWLSLLGLAIAMSVVVYFTDRVSPYGYYRNRRTERFNFSESLYMSLLVVVGKDGEVSRSWAARTILLFYFAFSLIVVSYYTANLTASLTVQMATVSISSLSDLAQPGAYFAIVSNSAEQSYFELPSMALYKNHVVLYDTYDECLVSLQNGDVQAVVGDSPTLEYLSNQQPCDTFVVGDIFFKSNYAIGLNYSTTSASASKVLSEGILNMRESGLIDNLYAGWWLEGSCGSMGDVTLASSQISIDNLAGAFAMLGIGIGMGIFVVLFEVVFNTFYKNREGGCFRHVDRFLGREKESEEHV